MRKKPHAASPAALLLWGLALAALFLSGACQHFMPDADKEEEPVDKFGFIDSHEKRYVETPDTSQHLVESEERHEPLAKVANKTVDLTRHETKPLVDPVKPKPAHKFYEDFILLNADESVEVALTFNTVPLIDVLPAFADILGFNFTADNDIKSTVTLNLNSSMTRRELWELFDATLRICGVAALPGGGNSLRIMLANKVMQQPDLRVRNRGDGSSEVLTCYLRYMTPRELSSQLRNFLTRAGAMIELPRQNILLVSDNSDNIAKLKLIIDAVDQPGRSNWPRAAIYCNHIKASRIAQDLADILPVLGLPVKVVTDRSETPGYIYINAVDRVQLLVVSAATEEALAEIKEWVGILDSADPVDQERVYIYKIAHGKASQLIQAMSAIFSTQGASLTIDTNSGNQRTEQVNTALTRNNNTQVANVNRYSTNNLLNIQTDQESSIFDRPIRVFADGVQNRLVIRSTPRAYSVIKTMLDRLDVVPAQVLLQVLVAEVELTDGNELGVEWNFANTGSGVGYGTGTHYEGSGRNNAASEGFKFGIFDPDRPDETFAFIRALATKDKVKIISSPQLLVTSNTEASIRVGERVPLLKSDLTNVQNPDSSSRSYEYEDTGIILTITPQVTSTDLIALELKQEISEAVKNTITSATDTPVIRQRILETSMSINNGRTMIIGGIIQENVKDNVQSVPFIANIPFLGRLLGNSNVSVKRTEMLVLITGYIVNEQSPVKEMVRRYNEAVKALALFEAGIEEASEADRARSSAAVQPAVEAMVETPDGTVLVETVE